MNRGQAQALVDAELLYAKAERSRFPFQEGGDSQTRPRISIIGPGGQLARLPVLWDNPTEKRRIFARVTLIAKATRAQAVMLCSDMSFAEAGKVLEHFKEEVAAQPGSPEYLKQVQAAYLRLQEKHLGGSLSNLPRHLFSHAVGAALKGEELGHIGRMVRYVDDGGKVRFEDENLEGKFRLEGIGDWWTIPDDDPNLAKVHEFLEEYMEKRP